MKKPALSVLCSTLAAAVAVGSLVAGTAYIEHRSWGQDRVNQYTDVDQKTAAKDELLGQLIRGEITLRETAERLPALDVTSQTLVLANLPGTTVLEKRCRQAIALVPGYFPEEQGSDAEAAVVLVEAELQRLLGKTAKVQAE